MKTMWDTEIDVPMVHNSLDGEVYPNTLKDPDAPSLDLPPKASEALKKTIKAFEDEIYHFFNSENSIAKKLCLDFSFTFRPRILYSLLKAIKFKWSQVLRTRGVHI